MALVALFPEADVYTSVLTPEVSRLFPNVEVRTSFLQWFPLVKRHRELLVPLTPIAFEQFDLSRYDLVISNTTFAAKGVITKPDCVHVCYCHTPARYLWEKEVDQRAQSGHLGFVRRYVAHKMRMWDRLAADRVDFFVANSSAGAARIRKYYRRDAKVIHPPVDVVRFRPAPRDQVCAGYLFVSHLVSYKRCDLVIDAFNELRLPLNVIGDGPEGKALRRRAGDNIRFHGFVNGNALADYYARSKALVFAAEEDFGIVMVEAMAAGRPVIAYRAGGAQDIVIEGETGTFFDKQTPGSLIDAVARFKDLEWDTRRLVDHAATFSISRFSRDFAALVGELAGDRRAAVWDQTRLAREVEATGPARLS
jgi:glycosyltransferase involved in cell wall biosynthesis